jgi:transposase-like protein
MRTTNIVKASDVLKDEARILQGIEDRVKGIVVTVLSGVEEHLSNELHGIAKEVMQAVMEFEILSVVGPKGRHASDRRYRRWGSNPGSVVINGSKVPCRVPRVVEHQSTTSYPLHSYQVFRKTGAVVSKAYHALINGISTRNFAQGVGAFVESYGLSASTVSRHMIAATAKKVEELLTRSLADVELSVLMIDGVQVAEHTVVIALGVDTQGVKHILGVRQGATENSAVAKGLLEDLIQRGLASERPILVVIDGAKALRKAVMDVFGEETPVQRCTVHKKRNVLDHLPEQERSWVSRRMSQAYDLSDEKKAERMLASLADQLQRNFPDAAKSLNEGLNETLTVQRLNLPIDIRRSLRSTNIIESANNGVRTRTRNVKRWQGGSHIERWVAASLLETEKKFRRIKGCKQMSVLIAAVDQDKKNRTKAA